MSDFGKFKNSDELLKAYEHAERELTRKSQLLAEFKKCEKGVILNEVKDPGITTQENGELSETLRSAQSDTQPVYENPDWLVRVNEFINTCPQAKSYSREIANEILSDDKLAKNPSALADAWARIASREYKGKEELVNDSDFLEQYVYSNVGIKRKIIEDFVKSKEREFVPVLISGASPGFAVTSREKLKTMDEARKEAEKLFK